MGEYGVTTLNNKAYFKEGVVKYLMLQHDHD